MLANIMLLRDCLTRGETAEIADERHRITIANSILHPKAPPGATMSVIPLSDCIVTLHGMKYRAEQKFLQAGNTTGISNVVKTDDACLEILQGEALVIIVI